MQTLALTALRDNKVRINYLQVQEIKIVTTDHALLLPLVTDLVIRAKLGKVSVHCMKTEQGKNQYSTYKYM